MGANIAGIYGAQIFRSEDKPLYLVGFAIGIGIISTAITLAIIRLIDDIIKRRRAKNTIEIEPESGSEGNAADEKKAATAVAAATAAAPAIA
jgi:hypothetical protein